MTRSCLEQCVQYSLKKDKHNHKQPLPNIPSVEDYIRVVHQGHILSFNILCSTSMTLFLTVPGSISHTTLKSFLSHSQTGLGGVAWVGVFRFSSRVWVKSIGIGQEWNNNNKALQRCFQAKNHVLEAKKSVKFLNRLIRLTSVTPSSPNIQSLCPRGRFWLAPNNQAASLLYSATVKHQIR